MNYRKENKVKPFNSLKEIFGIFTVLVKDRNSVSMDDILRDVIYMIII